jgi:hypothetical protein
MKSVMPLQYHVFLLMRRSANPLIFKHIWYGVNALLVPKSNQRPVQLTCYNHIMTLVMSDACSINFL